MNAKSIFKTSLLAAAFVLPGLAAASSDLHAVPGEIGYRFFPEHVANTKSRAQVDQELRQFRQAPLSNDGQFRYAGPEVGWVLEPHAFSWRDGALVHSDRLAHDTQAPAYKRTAEEEAVYRQFYIGG